VVVRHVVSLHMSHLELIFAEDETCCVVVRLTHLVSLAACECCGLPGHDQTWRDEMYELNYLRP